MAKGNILGSNRGHSGTHASRTGKVMLWGDNGYARATTEVYRDNYDKIFGDDRTEAQHARAEARREEIERIKALQ